MIFEELKQALISAAEREGLAQYEIFYCNSESVNADTLKDEINAFSSGVSAGISFRCVVDGKTGYASSGLLTVDAMEEIVKKAASNARCIDSDDEGIIFAGSPAYAKLPEREYRLADTAFIRENALKLQREAYAVDPRVTDGTQSSVASCVEEYRLYNSNGLDLFRRSGVTYAFCGAVVRDGEDAQEDYDFAVADGYDGMKPLAANAVRGAIQKIGAATVPSGKYGVVFDGKAFRGFLSTFSSVFSAKNAQLGLSLLAGKEGEKVAADCVTVTDDPMREGSPVQAPFDGEGVATSKKAVIENGVLKTLLYDLTTARKAGKESTGNGLRYGYTSPVSIAPYHFGLSAGDQSRDELLARIGDGIFINECKGFNAGANASTGDFSIESAGFRVRDGKLAEPVKSFTVAGNFFDLLKQIDCLGDKIYWGYPGLTCYGSPDVLIREMSIAGK